MNLDKIFPAFFFLCVGIGALIGHAGGRALSTANGAAIGVAVGLSPLLVLALFVGVITLWCPERPTCMCGETKSSDYYFISHLSRISEHVYVYRCHTCRRMYRQHENRFELRLAEHEFQPYMVISKWGRWGRSTH